MCLARKAGTVMFIMQMRKPRLRELKVPAHVLLAEGVKPGFEPGVV